MPTPRFQIRPAPALPLRRQIEIAADGIGHRLFRSALTLGVVLLAIAFLTYTLVEQKVARACQAGIGRQTNEWRAYQRFTAWLAAPLTPAEVGPRLADLDPTRWEWPVLAGWLGVAPDALAQQRVAAVALAAAERWFDELGPAQRRLLVGKRDRAAALAWLATDAGRAEFAAAARAALVHLPDGVLDSLAAGPTTQAALAALAARQAAAQARLANALAGAPVGEWFAGHAAADDARTLAAAGLALPPERLAALARTAAERRAERHLLDLLARPAVAAAWKKQFGGLYEQSAVIKALAGGGAPAAWLTKELPALAPDAQFDAAALPAAAARLVQVREWLALEDRLIAAYGAAAGLGAPTFWLLVLALLVCTAGITNAMLTSVLERFREIATMKCLGARDGFIARLFLLEAGFLGLCGGALGVLLGGALGVARLAASYGGWVARFLPWGELAGTAGIALLCGLGLATLSALYPAFAAARMPPMAAMRVE